MPSFNCRETKRGAESKRRLLQLYDSMATVKSRKSQRLMNTVRKISSRTRSLNRDTMEYLNEHCQEELVVTHGRKRKVTPEQDDAFEKFHSRRRAFITRTVSRVMRCISNPRNTTPLMLDAPSGPTGPSLAGDYGQFAVNCDVGADVAAADQIEYHNIGTAHGDYHRHHQDEWETPRAVLGDCTNGQATSVHSTDKTHQHEPQVEHLEREWNSNRTCEDVAMTDWNQDPSMNDDEDDKVAQIWRRIRDSSSSADIDADDELEERLREARCCGAPWM